MKLNKTLWVVQGALALLFVFAGTMKLALPLEATAGPIAFPGAFLRFIGVAEVLGGAGLLIIMIGATATTVATGGASPAVVPFGVGCLAAIVAFSRWQQAPALGV